MSLHVIFLLVACVCSVQCWNMGVSGRFPSIKDQQASSATPKTQQCFGLARRTRQLKINVPVVYNTKTRQTAPIPPTLYTADETAIKRMENQGWEVRRNSVYTPQVTYERVPVCCPWDQNCFQGRSAVPVQTSEPTGACANGGQLIYRDGQQRCECPPGFFGSWCQMRDTTGEAQSRPNFPSGPLIRVLSTPYPNVNALREAELRRSKVLEQDYSQDTHYLTNNRDSPPEFIASVSTENREDVFATYRAALLKQQIMKAKMAQVEEMYRQSQGKGYNYVQRQGFSPYDAGKGNKMWGRNPYNVIDARSGNSFPSRQVTDYNPYNALAYQRRFSGQDTEQNPYSALQYQGQLPPNMMRDFSAVQQEFRQKQAINPYNPYNRLSQEIPRPRPLMLTQRMYGDTNPYNRRPQGMDVPQARTPWDLDPFGQQQNPSYMNYPGMPMVPDRNKQAMAMAIYQQMLNQQRTRLSEGRNSLNSRPVNIPAVPQPVNVPVAQQPLSVSAGPVHGMIPPVARDSQPRPLSVGSTQEENNQSVEDVGASTGAQMVEQQRPSTNAQPETPLNGPSGQQAQPNSQEVKQIEQCQAILTSKLNACLKDYQLVMEQFMNPEFMQKARAVCAASEIVGQCIMQHDKACGEGDTILTTRKMINSALHMMGMICQQIAARGEIPNMPAQGPLGSPQAAPEETPMEENQPMPPNNPLSSMNEVQQPPVNIEKVLKQEKAMSHGQSEKSSNSNSAQDFTNVPEAQINEENKGHDSASLVSMELKLFGYPLWLVISLGLALFVALILFVVVTCLCCRRRCCQKSKKIEKIPIALERKVSTIDIPPPSYNTTIIHQNDLPLKLDHDDNEKNPTNDDSDNESANKETE